MPTSKWAEPCLCEAIVNWREKDLKKVPCDSYSRDLGHGGMAQAEGLHQINMGILYEKLPESMYGPGLPRSPKWDGDVNSCVPGYGMLWMFGCFQSCPAFVWETTEICSVSSIDHIRCQIPHVSSWTPNRFASHIISLNQFDWWHEFSWRSSPIRLLERMKSNSPNKTTGESSFSPLKSYDNLGYPIYPPFPDTASKAWLPELLETLEKCEAPWQKWGIWATVTWIFRV